MEGDVSIPQISGDQGDDEYVRENLTASFYTYREAAELLGVGPDEVGQATRRQSFNGPIISFGLTEMYYDTEWLQHVFTTIWNIRIKSVLPRLSTRFFFKKLHTQIRIGLRSWLSHLFFPIID